MLCCVKLVGNRLVNLGGIGEILIVLSGNCNVQSVVGTLVCIVYIYVVRKYVACLVSGADTCVNVYAVKCVTQNTKGQVSLNVSVLADGSSLLEAITSMESPKEADQVLIALPAVAASQVAPAEFFIS